MALDVWVGDWNQAGSERVTSFDPEAYYWFLYPLIEEFASTHGKCIDLYDGAEFRPDELPSIHDLLDRAVALVSSQPVTFDVHVGTISERKLYSTVEREAFLAFLEQVRSAVSRCERSGKPLLFYGD